MNAKNGHNRSRALVLVAAVTGLTAACGTDGGASSTAIPEAVGASCATATISGAGSTFVQPIVQQWVKEFSGACPGATVNYQGTGSGAGVQQLTAGTVDFAGSDVALTAAEQSAAEEALGAVVHIPWSAGGIAVQYNLPGVRELNLTAEALAGIFAGVVTRWDDEALRAVNRGVDLPSQPIQVVHRSDGSGTTAAFTEYLSTAAPSVWTAGSGKDVAWPVGQGAKGSQGVTSVVASTPGAVGYAEVSFAESAGLGVARIRNAGGTFVGPHADAVAAALGSATVRRDLRVRPDYVPTAPGAYPISTTTYVIVPQRPADPAKARVLKAFLLHALGQGQESAAPLHYAPLPPALAARAADAVRALQG